MLKTATPPLGGPVLGVKGPDGIVSPAHKAVPNVCHNESLFLSCSFNLSNCLFLS